MKIYQNLLRSALVVAQLAGLIASGGVLAKTPYVPTQPDPLTESWRWQTFPELASESVRCLVEDDDGSVWFGVDLGAIRYDGIVWTKYDIHDRETGKAVNAICLTTEGTVVVGTEWGVYAFVDGGWTEWTPRMSRAAWAINSLSPGRDGSVLAATAWGVLHLNSGQPKLITSEEKWSVIQTFGYDGLFQAVPDSVLAVQTWANGIGVALAEGSWLGLGRGVAPAGIWAVAENGPLGRAGVRAGDTLVEIEGRRELAKQYAEGEPGTSVNIIVQPKGKAEQMTLQLTREYVPGHYANFTAADCLLDSKGRLWIGCSVEGLVQMTTVGRGGEVVSYDLGSDTWVSHGLEMGTGARFMEDQAGHIWVVSNENKTLMYEYDGSQWLTHDIGDPRVQTNTSIIQARDGSIWVGGAALLTRQDGQWRVCGDDVDLPGLPGHRTRLMEASDGAIWLAGLGQYAVRFDYGSRRWVRYVGLQFQVSLSDDVWFTSQDSSLVHQARGAGSDGSDVWTRYDSSDGLMDYPRALVVSSEGTLWAAGGHGQVAATARFDGHRWIRQLHPGLSKEITPVGAYAASDGTVWFTAGSEVNRKLGQFGGMLNYDPSRARPSDDQPATIRFASSAAIREDGPWKQYPGLAHVPVAAYAMGESRDGRFWTGGNALRFFQDDVWATITEPIGLTSWIHAIDGTGEDLWVGTRTSGVFQLTGENWIHHVPQRSLGSDVRQILRGPDGTVWAGSEKGVSRYDGRDWTEYSAPLDRGLGNAGSIRSTPAGDIWFTRILESIRYRGDPNPPQTMIRTVVDVVSRPGNLSITWEGKDAWQDTPEDELSFAWRLDGGDWSPFTKETSLPLFALESGPHRIDVKARDRDLNEDPIPDYLEFTVDYPIWQQGWFLGLMTALVGVIVFQTYRVIRRDQRLHVANEELILANLEVKNQSRRKSQFLASMSHELRTPMNAIIGFTRIVVRRDPTLGEKTRENLIKVQQASDHLLAQINDLLDLSKIEAGRMDVNARAFSVDELIRSASATVTPLLREGVNLVIDVEDDIGEAHTDDQRLRQMVINLLSNAVKFTEEGSVTVTGGRESEKPGSPECLRISVRDTGQGIPASEIPTLFDEYRQVAGQSESDVQKGTGLGLSITKKFAQLLGGSIEVDSVVGEGSVFTIRVPVVYSEA